MPPYEFVPLQSAHLRAFLASCAEALKIECVQRECTFIDGLKRKLEEILEANRNTSTAQNAVIVLVCDFYERILALQPGDQDAFYVARGRVLDEMDAEILVFKVPTAV